jgi:hypothetical protein
VALLSFALIKLTFVAIKWNPDVSVFDEANQHQTEAEGKNLDEDNFQIAISVTEAGTGEIKHSPKYVDWLLTAWTSENSAYKKEYIGGLHPCTEEEYAKFHPRATSSRMLFDNLKKENAWMCMNDYDFEGKKISKTLFGITGNNSRTLDMIFIPCIPKQLTPYNKHLVDKECIADYKDPKSLEKKLNESISYVGRPQINIMTNN